MPRTPIIFTEADYRRIFRAAKKEGFPVIDISITPGIIKFHTSLNDPDQHIINDIGLERLKQRGATKKRKRQSVPS